MADKAEFKELDRQSEDSFSEGKLDIDKLLSLCGEFIDNDVEPQKNCIPDKKTRIYLRFKPLNKRFCNFLFHF